MHVDGMFSCNYLKQKICRVTSRKRHSCISFDGLFRKTISGIFPQFPLINRRLDCLVGGNGRFLGWKNQTEVLWFCIYFRTNFFSLIEKGLWEKRIGEVNNGRASSEWLDEASHLFCALITNHRNCCHPFRLSQNLTNFTFWVCSLHGRFFLSLCYREENFKYTNLYVTYKVLEISKHVTNLFMVALNC